MSEPNTWRWVHTRVNGDVPIDANEIETNAQFASELAGEIATEIAIELHREIIGNKEQFRAIIRAATRGAGRVAAKTNYGR